MQRNTGKQQNGKDQRSLQENWRYQQNISWKDQRNINNLGNADDTTLMAKSEEELKNFLMRVKESEKAVLKLNIQKAKIKSSRPITSWQIEGEKVKKITFFFLSFKITAPSSIKLRRHLFLEGKL